MVAITNTTSLTFLKDEIDATLSQAESTLEAFADDGADGKDLGKCAASFHQVRGVFQMLELPAAALLAEEMELVASGIESSTRRVAETAALGNAIVLLGRYLEYIQLKNQALPELVLGGINELRRAAGKALIPESHFFRVDVNRERYPEPPASKTPAQEIPRLCRRLRHMYQVGLLGVLREQNHKTSLKLMGRALERIDRLCGPVTFGRLLWVARAAIEAMLHGEMTMTPARKSLLAQYDRQLKRLIYEGEHALSAEPPLLLIKESVYVVSLAETARGVIGEVKTAFDLRPRISDVQLREEMALMSGGSGSVLRTVAVALKEELADLQRSLDMLAENVADADYADVADGITRIANTLVMVGAHAEAQKVKERALEVRNWKADEVDPESMEFRALIDDLLTVENAVAGLERRFAPADDVHRAAHNTNISLYQLDEARMTVVGECRSGMSLTKRSLSSFVESGWDVMHMTSVPGVLAGVSGGLTFLELGRARAVMDACRNYIDQVLLAKDAEQPTLEHIETLADAITSVDYYLESMEEQKPIGDAVLEVAEESMEELGYPVVRAV